MLASILYWLGYPKLIVVGSKSKSYKLLNNYLSCALFYLVLYYGCWRRKYQVRKGVCCDKSFCDANTGLTFSHAVSRRS